MSLEDLRPIQFSAKFTICMVNSEMDHSPLRVATGKRIAR